MRKVREVLRLRLEHGCSQRQIQASTGLSKGSVSDYLKRARAAGLPWEIVQTLSEAELELRLFKTTGTKEPTGRVAIDFEWVHREMRKKGVTLQLLCTEYEQAVVSSESHRLPCQYSRFCDLYSECPPARAPFFRDADRVAMT